MKKMMQDYRQLLESFRLENDGTEPGIENIKQFALQTSKVWKIAVATFNMKTNEYNLLRWPYESIFQPAHGFHDAASFYDLIHADDVPIVIDAKQRILCSRFEWSLAERLEYKLMYECRMKDTQNQYHRMLHQYLVLQLDAEGEIMLLLLFMEPVIAKTPELPIRNSVLIDTRTREKILGMGADILTRRELEILELVDSGMTSKQIAKKLGISVYTVDNHRRNILRKTGTSNIHEAALYARSLNLIGPAIHLLTLPPFRNRSKAGRQTNAE